MFGSVTRQNICQPFAPRLTAASSSSGPIASMTGISSRATNGNVTNAVARISPGVAKMIFRLWFCGQTSKYSCSDEEQAAKRDAAPRAAASATATTGRECRTALSQDAPARRRRTSATRPDGRDQVRHDRVAVLAGATARGSPAGRRSARTSGPPPPARPRTADRSAPSAASGPGSGSARSPRPPRRRTPGSRPRAIGHDGQRQQDRVRACPDPATRFFQ